MGGTLVPVTAPVQVVCGDCLLEPSRRSVTRARLPRSRQPWDWPPLVSG
ncbi:MAG: hypothetical protein K2W96_06545 [Gemmataceae bacterium]|nr:hypothetical protein [Gemmataceae bacterium]